MPFYKLLYSQKRMLISTFNKRVFNPFYLKQMFKNLEMNSAKNYIYLPVLEKVG